MFRPLFELPLRAGVLLFETRQPHLSSSADIILERCSSASFFALHISTLLISALFRGENRLVSSFLGAQLSPRLPSSPFDYCFFNSAKRHLTLQRFL